MGRMTMLRCVQKTMLVAVACSIACLENATDAAKRLTVPAAELLVAIEALQQQSDVQVVYNDADLKGIKTAGVNGELTTQEAVKKLLEGTKLRLSMDDATGAMMIVPLGNAERAGEGTDTRMGKA